MADVADKLRALLPCPFCGGEAVFTGSLIDAPKNHVICTKCPVGTRAFPETEAGEFWNRRTNDEPPLSSMPEIGSGDE